MGPGTLHLPARGRGQRGRSAGAERHMSEGMLLPWGRSKGKAGARGQRGLPGWRTRCWEVRLDDPGAGRDARGGIGLDDQRGGSFSHLWSRQQGRRERTNEFCLGRARVAAGAQMGAVSFDRLEKASRQPISSPVDRPSHWRWCGWAVRERLAGLERTILCRELGWISPI